MTFDDVKKEIGKLAEAQGLQVEDIRMTGGEEPTLAVFCDTEKGITFDEIREFTRLIRRQEWFDSQYSSSCALEVSSPGLDFPLTLPRHFRKNIGRLVKIRHSAEGIPSPVKGDIAEADETSVVIEAGKGKQSARYRIPLDSIENAKIKIKW